MKRSRAIMHSADSRLNEAMSDEEWIVRVHDKEYGPVDLETLHEWQSDGRLIPDNEVKQPGDTDWTKANTIPNLFPPPLPSEPIAPPPRQTSRGLAALLAETFRLYRRCFVPFFCLSLLVAVPGCGLRIALSYVGFTGTATPGQHSFIAASIAIFCAAVLLVTWPIFLAGIQLATAETRDGKRPPVRDLFRRATNFWPRVARLGLVVYGSYFLWSVIPLLAILSIVLGQPSLVSLLLALVILGLQVYMTARLFVNFLFWQQSCVLAGHNTIESLRESKELARSQPRAPMVQRPLFRGALLVSIWILVIIVVSIGVEIPFTLLRMRGVMTIEQAMDLAQKLAEAKPDAIALASYIFSSLVQALLRPLLGIAFVLLYFETKENHASRAGEKL